MARQLPMIMRFERSVFCRKIGQNQAATTAPGENASKPSRP
jgi:hypothetical protein